MMNNELHPEHNSTLKTHQAKRPKDQTTNMRGVHTIANTTDYNVFQFNKAIRAAQTFISANQLKEPNIVLLILCIMFIYVTDIFRRC